MNKKENTGCGCGTVIVALVIFAFLANASPSVVVITLMSIVIFWIYKNISKKKNLDKNNEKGLIKAEKNTNDLSQQSFVKSNSQELSQSERVKMYNNQYDYMTGEDFEAYVAMILKQIGFLNIQLTKGSGDQGVDIIAEKDGMKYAFQCKRYDNPVGNKAVQEVFAGKFFYHCHVAVVVTNNYFTQSAKDLAYENGVVLWDRSFLQKFIGVTNENKTENDILMEYNENRGKDELIILDIEEKLLP